MMDSYKKIDMETWSRKEHYLYYTEKLKVECNLTVNIQVDSFIQYCHSNNYRFFAALVCVISHVIDSIDNLKMFKDAEGNVCVWEHLHPNYTLFHEDDHTFSDCWSLYDADFDRMYQNVIHDMDTYKDVKGIKSKENQPRNFYCISCTPWMHFAAYSARTAHADPQFFPIITVGKYENENGKMMMPVNLIIAHAVCDGYHASLFFNKLQDALNNFQ